MTASMSRGWRGLAVAIVLSGAVSGCVPGPAGPVAQEHGTPSVIAATEGLPGDRKLKLPSGATVTVAADWTVTAVKDGFALEDPDGRLKVELVEVTGSAGLQDAIASAWRLRRPGFDRQELASSDLPGREGWDQLRWARYKTSPAEVRRVSASAARKGALAAVVLIDGPVATVQRRSS